MKRSYFILLSIIYISCASIAGEVVNKLSMNSGENLLRLGLPWGKAVGYHIVSQNENIDKSFYTYQLFRDNHYGSEFYAVNSFTGDVWDTVSCVQLSNPDLQREQARIKQQFKGEAIREYNKLHLLHPVNPDLQPC